MTLPCSLALVALRPPGAADLPAAVAPELARRLGAEWLRLDAEAAPAEALARLRAPGASHLAAIPHDPGLPLAVGGSWAEALGAWRQPTLLLVACPHLASGLPAAATALLRQWQVPLVGLLQWDGPWSPQSRRADGLPWLGCAAELDDAGLRLLVERRLQRLVLPSPAAV
ncbi:MAG: hypothetical protein VKK62_03520 [Synechococcaceae cyanobacterium]|nr:hypothetical protein [Synechococcaceae cyanobacterium]